MEIFLETRGFLQKYFRGQEKAGRIRLQISSEIYIMDLIKRYRIPKGFVSIISVNGMNEGLDYKIKDGDFIKLYPPPVVDKDLLNI